MWPRSIQAAVHSFQVKPSISTIDMSRKPTEIDPHAVDAYVERCNERATAPRVSEFAWELGISRVTLNLRFQEKTGTSLSAYFAARRERTAATLLVESDL